MSRALEGINWRTVGGLVALAVVTALLWQSVVVYPLKILVVFFHELSHGLAAVATGGQIVEIEVVKEAGGHCITRGGSRFVTLSAGYLGSLIWGGLILLTAARTRLDRGVSVFLGLTLVTMVLLYVRPFAGFGFGFGLGSGVLLAAAGVFLSEQVNDFLLRWIGLTSCIYAILDIKSDVLDRPELRSDAAMLGELTSLSPQFWGVVWIVVAILGASVFLLLSCREGRPPPRAG
ncbi:MAG: M50 family metallopeptidase [Myxococcales bacterium]|nr:M50 family metallopeptidase [Myxococcales bacterium]MCB9751647.1 M50 family metallopeptidase [Myxococcales bacterium]